MSDSYTPITQGLRERLRAAALGLVSPTFAGLPAECDNIDAIHKALEDSNEKLRETVAEHARSNVEAVTFLDRLSDAAEKREDVTLFGVDYTALPLDADGEYIHIGDVMENLREDLEPKLHHRFKVYGIQYRDYGQVCALTEDCYPSTLYRANECRHYHAPTVEDMLREFVAEFNRDDTELCDDEIIERFAKRLQLAEVDE